MSSRVQRPLLSSKVSTCPYHVPSSSLNQQTIDLSTSTLPSPLTPPVLAEALKSTIASKQYGLEDILSKLVSEAALAVMPSNTKNFNVDNVRVVKIMGSNLATSKVVQGMVFGREPEGTERR